MDHSRTILRQRERRRFRVRRSIRGTSERPRLTVFRSHKHISAQIVDAASGGKPSTRQLVVRYLGYYVSIIPLFMGLFWVAFDRRKQGWHDKLAGTVVVRSKK